MRTREEINREYSQCCVSFGDKNHRRKMALKLAAQLGREMEEIEEKSLVLMVEKASDEAEKSPEKLEEQSA